MTLAELHTALQLTLDSVAALTGKLPNEISTNTAFAIGAALGAIGQAKALVEQDMAPPRVVPRKRPSRARVATAP